MSFHKCKFTENLTCTWLFNLSVDLSEATEIEIGLFCITADADGIFRNVLSIKLTFNGAFSGKSIISLK